jgi:hypothetical protein
MFACLFGHGLNVGELPRLDNQLHSLKTSQSEQQRRPSLNPLLFLFVIARVVIGARLRPSILNDLLRLNHIFLRHLKPNSRLASNKKVWSVLRCRFVWNKRRNISCRQCHLQAKRFLNVVTVRDRDHTLPLPFSHFGRNRHFDGGFCRIHRVNF